MKTPQSKVSKSRVGLVSAVFAQQVLRFPELQHGAVRVGLWMAAIADLRQSTEIDFFISHIMSGYDDGAIAVRGIAIQPITARKSIESLVKYGLITVDVGKKTRVGHASSLVTFV